MTNRETAIKIYEKLLEKGAGIGNASIPIIEKVLDESIPMQLPVMQKAMVIWVTYDEYGDLEKEFIYPEEEESKMPYQCEKYLMYNKNKTAKRLSCFSA